MRLDEGSTPGPWNTGKGQCHAVFGPKINGHRQVIAHCPTQNGKRDYDSMQVFANARLIAKAPLLLEARDLLEQLNDPVYLIAPMTIETIARIRALLTKLESED